SEFARAWKASRAGRSSLFYGKKQRRTNLTLESCVPGDRPSSDPSSSARSLAATAGDEHLPSSPAAARPEKGKPRGSHQARRAATRSKVLEAGIRILHEEGYHAATTTYVAQRA